MKSYKQKLDIKFKNKISELKNLTLDQEKFNSFISELISEMGLDENVDDDQKRDDENEQNEKQSKPHDQDLQTENKSEKQDEMSINSVFLILKIKQESIKLKMK